ncbi:MAG: hypothetical protein E5W93_12600 [Mesorhizobium sp.]|nr:MAG: hypothetical protein E5W93_12600 [Mesorhizobium sp.]
MDADGQRGLLRRRCRRRHFERTGDHAVDHRPGAAQVTPGPAGGGDRATPRRQGSDRPPAPSPWPGGRDITSLNGRTSALRKFTLISIVNLRAPRGSRPLLPLWEKVSPKATDEGCSSGVRRWCSLEHPSSVSALRADPTRGEGGAKP